MAESRQRRDQLDMPFPAIGIQFQDILRLQRILVPPGLAEVPEQIRMLNVQLKLVDLVFTQQIHNLFQAVQGENPAAGNILIEPPVFEIRPVFNFQAGQHSPVPPDPLPQGTDAVEQSLIAAAGNPDSIGRNRQPVMIRLQCGVLIQENTFRYFRPAENVQPESGGCRGFIPDHSGPEQRAGSGPFGENDLCVPAEPELAFFFSENMGKRQKLHGISLLIL